MRYPKECPVFEVVKNDGSHAFKLGTHVVCELSLWSNFPLMASDGERLSDQHFCDGPQYMAIDQLRPLTRAARDMLALVTGEAPR